MCPSICSSCDGEYPKNNCICTLKKYKNPQNGQCDACTSNCWSCTGPGINECVTCHSDFVQFNGKCEINCPDRYRKQLYYQDYNYNTLRINRCI